MDATDIHDRTRVELEAASRSLCASTEVLEPLLASITARNVRPAQVPGLLKAGYLRLEALRDRLANLSADSAGDDGVAAAASGLGDMLETGKAISPAELASRLEDIERTATAAEPTVLALILECRALASATGQDHLAAADLCRQAADMPGIPPLRQWHLVQLQATLLGEHGREFDDDTALLASAELLRTRALPLAEACECLESRAGSLEHLGNVLGIIGQRRMGTRYLEDAIDAFRAALDLMDPGSAPVAWAAVQNGLGNALGALGQRQADDELLNRAVEAFEQALALRSEEQTPGDWASTMNNLAAVLQSIGRKRKDPKILKRAVESYKGVLRVWTRGNVPLDWAAAMDNLGSALRALGEHRRGPRTLEQAVAAYRSALAERPRDRLPGEWAMTHNNLGAALQKLAQREESLDIMEKALQSYESTLLEWTREKSPMTWAMAMANLGVARQEQASMTGDIETADRAVGEIQSAVGVFRGASHAQYTELGEEQLSFARQLLEKLIAQTDAENTEATRIALKINT